MDVGVTAGVIVGESKLREGMGEVAPLSRKGVGVYIC